MRRVMVDFECEEERMIPLHELLSRIHWDTEFGRGECSTGYLDHLRGGSIEALG